MYRKQEKLSKRKVLQFLMNCESFSSECSVEQWTFHTVEVKAAKIFPIFG